MSGWGEMRSVPAQRWARADEVPVGLGLLGGALCSSGCDADVEAEILAGRTRWKRMLGFVLVATVLGPPGPRARLFDALEVASQNRRPRRQPPSAFHPSGVTATVMETLRTSAGSPLPEGHIQN